MSYPVPAVLTCLAMGWIELEENTLLSQERAQVIFSLTFSLFPLLVCLGCFTLYPFEVCFWFNAPVKARGISTVERNPVLNWPCVVRTLLWLQFIKTKWWTAGRERDQLRGEHSGLTVVVFFRGQTCFLLKSTWLKSHSCEMAVWVGSDIFQASWRKSDRCSMP